MTDLSSRQANVCSIMPAGGGRVSRRALPERAEPRQGHGLRLVAEPVHGLRAPLHVLLRARLRAARRPAVRRPLRALDPREGERRRGAAQGARPAVVGGRDRRDRRCHRPVPAGRGSLQAHARLPRGAPRRVEPVQPDHAQPDDRPRPRRPRRGGEAGARSESSSRCRRSTRRSGGAPSPGPLRPQPPPRGAPAARRRGRQGGRRDGADPSGHLRLARTQLERGRPRRARGRRDEHLGERPLPQARDARALPRGAGPRLAGGARPLRATSTRTAPTCPKAQASRSVRWSPSCARSTASATAAGSSCEPEPRPEPCSSRWPCDGHSPLYDRAWRHAGGDHRPDRRRPRGRPRRAAPVALARARTSA